MLYYSSWWPTLFYYISIYFLTVVALTQLRMDCHCYFMAADKESNHFNLESPSMSRSGLTTQDTHAKSIAFRGLTFEATTCERSHVEKTNNTEMINCTSANGTSSTRRTLVEWCGSLQHNESVKWQEWKKKLVQQGFWESARWEAHIHGPVPLSNAVHLASHWQPYLVCLSSQPGCVSIKKASRHFNLWPWTQSQAMIWLGCSEQDYQQTHDIYSNKKIVMHWSSLIRWWSSWEHDAVLTGSMSVF